MGEFNVRLVKRSSAKAATKGPHGHGAADFILVDNEDNTATVQGETSAHNPVDISSIATLDVVSDNPAVITVDAPVGMTFAYHAVGPVGTAKLTITATWTDGSVGPFTIDLPGSVVAGGPTGVMVTLGTPTSR